MITEIRFVVRCKVAKNPGTWKGPSKIGQFYRMGIAGSPARWFDSPFDATLFTASNVKSASRLKHGLLPSEFELVEVEVSMTDLQIA